MPKNRLVELLGKARGLSGSERWTVIRSSAMLPAVWMALRLLPIRRLLLILRPATMPIPSPGDADPIIKARSTARLVGGAASFSPFPSTCLSKSLVLWSLLLRTGTNAEIRIGVLKDRDDFAAHAWVEVDGTPVNDTADVVERHEVFADPLTAET
jgi:hypothetical protein